MTNEPKTPFKVGEIYKTRSGAERKVLFIADHTCKTKYPIVSHVEGSEDPPKTHTIDGRFWGSQPHSDDLLPPAPPEPKRRTVFFNMYDNCVYAHFTKESANSPVNLNGRQGEAVPVPLERQPDGGWRVVAEKTAKELAADEMYEALQITLHANSMNLEVREAARHALAKAEGRE